MLLEVRDLKVNYAGAEALRGISIGVDEACVVSIVGANGAGKSTLLRTISGLKKPASGEICFEEGRIDGLPAHRIVKMGIVQIPEGGMIFSPMSVLANLKMGAYLRRDKSGVAEDLEAMYRHFPILRERSGQRAGTLSGGERKMLAIARALMARPRLLLMDEPSMGVAPIVLEEISRAIRDIEKRGISIVLVEQNSRMAFSLAKRAYILEVGRIVGEGSVEELAHDERVKKAYLGG
jgi:branched-chain amino acid transport system ATP-binding protein